SAARTAYASMAVCGSGGTSSSAVSPTDVTQPSASSNGTARGCRGRHPASTRRRASSSGITGSYELLALDQVGEEGAELGAQVLALDGQLDGGAQVVDLL